MNLSDLRALVRLRMRDTAAPYLFSDDEIDANLNEAQREACVRALLIEDDSVTQIDIVTTDKRYDLDPRIVDVIGISIGAALPRDFTDGWTLTETHLILDRFPTAADTLTLRAHLLPSSDMVSDSDEPEIRPVYHQPMADWAISLCYLAPDAETFDQQAADRYAARFTQSFGERPSALTRRNHRDKSAKAVAYNGGI